MDKLDQIFKEQKDFQYFFYDLDKLTQKEKVERTKEFILCAHRELGEILNLLPWKSHRNIYQNTNINIYALSEEAIDCFKFMLNIFLIWGIDADKFKEIFDKKSKIVRERYHIEHTNLGEEI